MAFEKYFRDELDYLHQIGRIVAREKPHLAEFLSEKGVDPDVERLLEGFAFLSGNLREKIDDEFPELTHSLLNMLWPNYLRPTPSMTIIEYTPEKNIITEATKVTRGTELLSRPIQIIAESDDGLDPRQDPHNLTHCVFTQCRDLWLLPVELDDIRVSNSNEMAVINIDFSASGEISINDLELGKLRFWLGEAGYSSYQLYFWLSYYFEKAELIVGDESYVFPDFDFVPLGFGRDESMLPWPKNSVTGYRILQEYFCFPEGYLFFDVKGVPKLPTELHASQFSLRLSFSRPLPPEVKIRRDSLRLHCTPAVNLFSHYSESILLDGTQTEYPLRVSYSEPDFYDIFSVDKVESWLKNDAQDHGRSRGLLRTYTPFESFQHQIEYTRGREKIYYRVRIKPSVLRAGLEHTISFVRGDELKCVLNDETISIQLTCTNRKLPTLLRIGDIDTVARDTPSFASFRNITRPTTPLYPVLDGSLTWSLISNMSLNYLSLLNKDALRQILLTYDLPGQHDRQAARGSQKKMDGIVNIETQPVDRLFRGVPVRGLESTLWLEQSAFSCEGELYLFGTILARFFSLYASVNSFHILKVINTNNKECYEWPEQKGQHSLI
ncbi:type VI secretion system baseplate subunit TssF [Trabulsiella odontotermitis]|uniref:Type VI secretion protein n=1 Tax=Trabulsiella odontotermitis TaxID=379893 RepID=A0A0L0GNK3_9ENTR|nr:type VI secretion system baseplate subunit TssF [Trabulsiella odontotermitis]KNC89998.1 type VI secretion protein [Trabulsiella odontotermitis]